LEASLLTISNLLFSPKRGKILKIAVWFIIMHGSNYCFCTKKGVSVELEFVFRESALKHGLTEADIRHVFETCCYVGQYQEHSNVLLLLGFDQNANPVEILYNEWGDNCCNVFHAMHCQKKYYHLFEKGEMP
jgi:hypothetical protein